MGPTLTALSHFLDKAPIGQGAAELNKAVRRGFARRGLEGARQG